MIKLQFLLLLSFGCFYWNFLTKFLVVKKVQGPHFGHVWTIMLKSYQTFLWTFCPSNLFAMPIHFFFINFLLNRFSLLVLFPFFFSSIDCSTIFVRSILFDEIDRFTLPTSDRRSLKTRLRLWLKLDSRSANESPSLDCCGAQAMVCTQKNVQVNRSSKIAFPSQITIFKKVFVTLSPLHWDVLTINDWTKLVTFFLSQFWR